MRINYEKSDMIGVGLDEDELNAFANLFCCKVGTFPITYLGVPLHFNKLRREDIQPVVDKVIKRVAGWRGKLLSYGGRLTLLKSCLASIPTYLLSVIKFPKWAIDAINSQMAHFLWNNHEGEGKYHLANWQLVSQRKEVGGMGIPDLHNFNLCLLASWISRYHLSDNALWKKIVEFKYRVNDPNLFCCPDINSSPFWKGVLWAVKAAQMGYSWKIGNGQHVRFWEDRWFGSSSLAIQYWPLYVLVNEKESTIAECWDGVNLKFTFRRTVSAYVMRMWEEILGITSAITLSEEPDSAVWTFNSNGVYSVQSLYAVISFRGVQPIHTPVVWKLNIPPRIQVFLWLLSNNKLLTRDNLSKRRNVENKSCLFCAEPESVNHLFFGCCVAANIWNVCSDILETPLSDFDSIAKLWLCRKKHYITNMCTSAILWSLWKMRNALCFQGLVLMDVKRILSKAAGMLRRWRVLCKDSEGARLGEIAEAMDRKTREPARLTWPQTDASPTFEGVQGVLPANSLMRGACSFNEVAHDL